MNKYKEDDSGKLLGDLLLTISDDDLAKLLMEANGQIVLAIQDNIAYGCDTKESTWLERAEKAQSYEVLRKAYIKSYNCNTATADANLKRNYNDTATMLAENWDDIKQHIDHVNEFTKKNGLDKMSSKELKQWYKDNVNEKQEDMEIINYAQERDVVTLLAGYKYEDKTLLDFFSQDYEEISGKNIKRLYPIAAALSNGQKSAVDETVSMFKLVINAAASNGFNDVSNTTTKMMDDVSEKDKEKVEEAKETLEKIEEAIDKTDPISVYDGVDREIFDGNVAVTSIAENYSKGNKNKWTDSFVESGAFAATTISLGVLSLVSLSAAIICAKVASKARVAIMRAAYTDLNTGASEIIYSEEAMMFSNSGVTFEQVLNPKTIDETFMTSTGSLVDDAYKAQADLLQKGQTFNSMKGNVNKMSLCSKLKIGLAVFAIVLCAVDIVVTCITLVNYYNRKHDAIPKFMVDVSYNEDKETSYINYKSVPDDNNTCGDLNGEGGKQWLALYATKDKNAGKPIMAPGPNSEIKVKYGKTTTPSGYSPLHMFGTPNAAQNLTFADGENGFSFNDKKGGTYLFFKRDEFAMNAGTTMSKPSVWVGMAASLLIGLGVGICATTVLLKRRKKKA